MPYTFDQIFAADPANPANVAQNSAVTIFTPGDATMAPLTITTPDGAPLANPVVVNANGFGSAFAHATLDRVAWAGGGFSGFFTSYEGMKSAAVAAQAAAETAGANAASAATASLASAVADADASRADAATSAAAAVNAAGLVGAPADAAISASINNPNSQTYAALTALIAVAPAPAGGDDTAMLNALLTANAGKVVQLRAGRVYKINTTLTVPTDTVLDLNGATIDATGIPAATALGQRAAITANGTKDAALPVTTAVALSARIVAGISSTAGLKAGDLVMLRNDERPVAGMTRTDRSKGELNIIRSVDSGTQVTLTAASMFAYSTTGLVIEKVNPARNVRVEGGKILMGGVGSGHCGVQAQYGQNITVKSVAIDGAEDTGINFRTVWNGKVIRGSVKNSTSSATIGTTGYGVAITEGSRACVVDTVEFTNCRHFVTGGGYWPASYVDVKGCFGYASLNAAFDTHESCFYWNFTGNRAVGVSGGFSMRGQFVTVEGNTVADATGIAYEARTFDGVTEQRGIKFRNNEATRCATGLSFEGSALGAEPACPKIDGEMIGNTLTDCGNATTDAAVIRNFDGMKVWGNTIQRAGRNGMLIVGLTGAQSKNLILGLNHIFSPGSSCIDMQYVDDVSYHGGLLVGPVKNGLNVTNCNRVGYSALSVRNPGNSGVNISGGSEHTFTGPVISGGTNASYDGIRVSGSADLSVVGGKLSSARYGVYSTTTDYVTISGVNLRGNTNASRYSVDATNKVILAGSNLL